MTKRTYPWWHPQGSSLSVGLVAVGAGLLFAANAQLFEDREYRTPQNLVELVQVETQKLESREKAVSALRERVDQAILQAGETETPAEETPNIFGYLDKEMTGAALEVQLWDAPKTIAESGQWDPNQLVVHQQDVEAVMNALWSGGAEAMTVQGQRLAATSGVRCVGNVLLVHDQRFSPPYVITAIGDPARLKAARADTPQVHIYRQYVAAAGLGLSVTDKASVTMPAYEGTIELNYAKILEGTG